MTDYIDKNKLKDALRNLYRYESFPIADIEQLIDSMDIEFVKHGHWEWDGYVYDMPWQCSECRCFNEYDSNYCPECGAKMDKVEE